MLALFTDENEAINGCQLEFILDIMIREEDLEVAGQDEAIVRAIWPWSHVYKGFPEPLVDVFSDRGITRISVMASSETEARDLAAEQVRLAREEIIRKQKAQES